jgi:hypothetical protein
MEKEFAPYEESLAVKELGFDEPCLGNYYQYKEHSFDCPRSGDTFVFDKDNPIRLETYPHISERSVFLCTAPLYQQLFRWFREKYKLFISIHADTDNGEVEGLYYSITEEGWLNCYESLDDDLLYQTYEEAELACLRKLIEIVKEKT